jgi:CubicO group peptidase (beta-lactamase class C family)
MQFHRVPAIVLTSLLLSCCGSAQSVNTLPTELRGKIDAVAGQVLSQTGVPSASVAVVLDGKVAYTHGYGLATLTPAKPATPEMRYSIGSISKQFTAAALLILQEQGKLSLDDKVAKYLPKLTRADEITLRMVVSHTSGYQDYWAEDYVMPPMLHPAAADEIMHDWAMKPLDFDPGTRWQYSNTNYVIAGRIAEMASGEPLFLFLQEHIFVPLGMKSVWDSDATKLTGTDATAYYRHALGPLRVAPKEGKGWMFAAGELAMTAHDLALWDVSLMAQNILKPESYRQMFTEVKLKDGTETGYGLGVFVKNEKDGLTVEHSGEVSGFVSDHIVGIDKKYAVVVLTNQDASPAASRIAGGVAKLLASRTTSPGAAEALAQKILEGLQQGRIDRSLLAPNCDAYFSQEALDDFAASLGPLGPVLSIQQRGDSLRGGMSYRGFLATFATKRVRISTYTYPDGKIEQYLVEPAE